ncbi:MAG: preprotein translocase subunit YajC [Ignavibacteria bacterium]
MIKLIFLLQQSDGTAGIIGSLLPFVLIIAVFYFLILRPQQRRQKEKQKLLESIKKGDRVVTSGGIHGTVEGLEDKTVLMKIADNTKIKIERSAIATIIGLTPEEKN